MPKKINYQLNNIELQTIKEAMTKAAEPEVRPRATAIHLLHLGHSPAQVAEMLSVKVGSIYNWHRRWRAAGLMGLADQPKSGRRLKADEAYCHVLETAVESDPQTLGYEFTLWTAQRLIEHLYQATGKRLSLSHLRAVLKQRGFVYRRPKHDLKPLQEPEARQEALDLIEVLKKKPKLARLSSSLWTKRP